MEKDAEPMQPLVDLWVSQGVLPKVEKMESAGAGAGVGGNGA